MAYGGSGSGYGDILRRTGTSTGSRYGAPQPSRSMQPQQAPAPQPQQAPAPAPVYTGRIPQTAAPAPAAPQQGYGQMLQGQAPVNGMGTSNIWDNIRQYQAGQPGGQPQQDPGVSGFDNMIRSWSPEYQQRFADFSRSLDYNSNLEGNPEIARLLRSQYAMLLNQQMNQPKVDLSGYSEVADQYDSQRQRMQNDLAAGGFSGSGVMAGAMANMAGSQARAQGSFIRDALEQRRREQLAQEQDFMNKAFGANMQSLGREWQTQDEPSFWEDALGVAGGIAGTALGGPLGGAIGKGVSGLFGGGGQPDQSQYGYTYQDESQPWLGGWSK